jgi:predicted amidohydrolase YtcJ
VLKVKADKTPDGELVSGSRYDDIKLGRHPNRYDLDKASARHPILISHASGHIIVVNSYVLKASGITKETKDPPGGSFDRRSRWNAQWGDSRSRPQFAHTPHVTRGRTARSV